MGPTYGGLGLLPSAYRLSVVCGRLQRSRGWRARRSRHLSTLPTARNFTLEHPRDAAGKHGVRIPHACQVRTGRSSSFSDADAGACAASSVSHGVFDGLHASGLTGYRRSAVVAWPSTLSPGSCWAFLSSGARVCRHFIRISWTGHDSVRTPRLAFDHSVDCDEQG
jgi:hypothetical protein